MPVQHIRLLAHTLEHTAVQEDLCPVTQGQQVLRTGDRAGCTMERNLHQMLFLYLF
jgi:hypothetical protein